LTNKINNSKGSLHGYWSSRISFILAVAGSAVGLGNIWKFPYIAGVNGGGAFVLVYILCVFLIGLPILVSEILIGRMGRRNPASSMEAMALQSSSSKKWAFVGLMGILSGVLILSYYSVIAGWSLAYIFESFSGTFVNANSTIVEESFFSLSSSWKITMFWHSLFMIITAYVVSKGVAEGLEKAVRLLMPLLILLLLILLVYSALEGEFIAGLSFMFAPRFHDLTADGILVALGHAFFTLSVGMGAIMAYGAYLPDNMSIGRISISVVLADTFIALISGLVIFPIVFANGLDPEAGPGLVFMSLPMAFGNLPGGIGLGVIFFTLLSFAAWTSAISLMEPAVAWAVEKFKIQRVTASFFICLIIWVFGLGTVFSFSLLSDFLLLGRNIFDNLDYLTSNILLPLGGLMIVIFASWVVNIDSLSIQLDKSRGIFFRLWLFLSRYIAPIGVMIIFFYSVNIFST
tara:strand:+ start:19034 stop:20413 length:1380 start_codon:yes stop_codon:yes gene_type:complete